MNTSSLTTSAFSDSIAAVGEVGLIKRITNWLGPVSPSSPQGIGDDCAVVPPSPSSTSQIITVDTVTFGQHFDNSVSAEDAGAKLIKRNLSDIAAMGGTPGSAVLALLCGSDIATLWLESFFKGIRATCEAYDVQLVGGDISSIGKGNFSAVLTLTGNVQTPKLRSSAKSNDYIYVTGSLGGSILGKHYKFRPRLAEGKWLAEKPHCTAQMDLTDGLAKDLRSILPPGTHAALNLDQTPISEDAYKLSHDSGRSALEHAYCDGEDYELLFTLSQHADRQTFETEWQTAFPGLELHQLGRIEHGNDLGQLIDTKTKTVLPWSRGFEHLKAE